MRGGSLGAGCRVVVVSNDDDRDVLAGARLLLDALDLARAGVARVSAVHAAHLRDGIPENADDSPEARLSAGTFNIMRDELRRRGVVALVPAPPAAERFAAAEALARASVKAGNPWRAIDFYAPPGCAPIDLARAILAGGSAADHPSEGRDEVVRFVHKAMVNWVETWERPKGQRGGGKRPVAPPVMDTACVVVLAPLVGLERADRCMKRLHYTDSDGRFAPWVLDGAGRHSWPVRLTFLAIGADLGFTDDGAIHDIVKRRRLVP